MIQIENLSKVFRTSEVETIALNHVNIEVKEGEFVAIMGPSGCGKSTLLNILGLLDNPTEGSYKLLGNEVANLKEKERTRLRKGVIGFVFQSFNLIDELNVFENVELPLTYLGIKASERKERVLEILKRMNLSHRAKHFPQQLSGGQQQAMTLLMASLQKPQLLLLDEHTAALDPKTAAKVLALTEKIIAEHHLTAMMVTLNMKDAIRLGNRLIMMHEGRIIYDVAGEEKKNLQVSDLLAKFEQASGGEFANDRMMLA